MTRALERLTGRQLDPIDVEWAIDDGELHCSMTIPEPAVPPAGIIAAVCRVADPGDLVMLAEGVVTGGVRSWDAGGLAVGDDGILFWDAIDREALASAPAVARLLRRSLRSLVDVDGSLDLLGVDVHRAATLVFDELRQLAEQPD